MKKLSVLLITFLIFSCTSKTFDSKEELYAYIKNPKNGYLQQKNVNGYEFSLLYKPTDLLIYQELSENLKRKERERAIKKLRVKYKKYLYFTLSMSKNGQELLSVTPKNRQEFGAMVNQLAFQMDQKVHLFTAAKDTIPLVDYSYPRMYGMSGATTMLFVYSRDEKYLQEKHLSFTIEDLGTYTGEVKFKIQTEKIRNQLQINLIEK